MTYVATPLSIRPPSQRRSAPARGAVGDMFSLLVATVLASTLVTPALAYNRAFFLGAAAVWAVARVTRRGQQWPIGSEIAFVGLAALSVASLGWTVSEEVTRGAVAGQLACASVFLLIRATVATARDLRMACLGLVIAGLLAVGQIIRQAGSLRTDSGFGYDRVNLTGLNPNYLAYGLAAAIAVLVILNFDRPTPAKTIFSVWVGAVMLLGINTAGTRGALVAVVLVAIWVSLARLALATAWKLLLGAFVAVSLLIVTGGTQTVVRHVATLLGSRDRGDLTGRIPLWNAARAQVPHHWLTGSGAGTFRALNPAGLVAHNGWLEVAVGLGLFGVGLLATTLYLALIRETKSMPARPRHLLVGTVICASAPCFLSGHWVQSPTLWGVIALASCLPRVYIQEPTASASIR